MEEFLRDLAQLCRKHNVDIYADAEPYYPSFQMEIAGKGVFMIRATGDLAECALDGIPAPPKVRIELPPDQGVI